MKTIPILITLLLFVSFVSAINETSLQPLIDEASFNTVSVSDVTNSSGKLDFTLSRGSTSVQFSNVYNPEFITKIYFNPNLDYDTSAVTFNEFQFDSAIIILKKNKENYPIKNIMTSKDGINFTFLKDKEFHQNSTHVWFNVSHFSSWTASIESPIEVIIDNTKTINVNDFATIDSGDYIQVCYNNYLTSGCLDNHYMTAYDTVQDSSGSNIYDLTLSDTNSIIINPYSSIPNDYFQDNTFSILVRNNDESLDIGDLNIGLTVRTYQEPLPITQNPSSIGDTSATLRGYALFNDHTSSVNGEFKYRKVGTSIWSYTSYDSITNDVTKTETISGLEEGTSYEYSFQIGWTSDYTSSSMTVEGDIKTFTTTTSSLPTITTVQAISGDTIAYLRGLVDFNSYIGNDVGIAFNYSSDGFITGTRVPSSGWEVPSDGIVFTSSQITGLTNNQEYQYYPIITYDSGNKLSKGETLKFTPSVTISGDNEAIDLNAGAVAYYKFEEVSLNYVDSVHGYDFTSNTGLNPDKVAGKLNYGQECDADTNDEIYTDSQNAFKLTDPLYSMWIYVKGDILGTFFSLYDGTSNGPLCYFYDVDNSIYCNTFNGGASDSVKTAPISLNTWYHLGYYFNSTTGDVTLYINGVKSSTENSEGISSIGYGASTSIEIGERIGGSSDFYGIIDELYIGDTASFTKSSIDDIMSYLYNGGNPTTDQQYLFPTGNIKIPSAITLSSTNITTNSALLRGIGYFNDSIYSLNPAFRWRINNTSSWTNYTSSLTSASNSTFYYGISGLDFNTIYEYQAMLSNSSGYYYIGNSSYFQTLTPEIPTVNTLNAVYVSNDTASLYGYIYFSGWNAVNRYFKYREVGNPVWTTSNYTTLTESDYVTLNLNNLIPRREYEFYLLADYDNFTKTIIGNIKRFNTTENGAPIISTSPATNILRSSAKLFGVISDIGDYTELEGYFRYYNTTDIFEVGNYSISGASIINKTIYNLSPSTNYSYEFRVRYGLNKDLSGGSSSFSTLSLDDYIGPTIESTTATNINFNNATLGSIVYYNNETTVQLKYDVYDDFNNKLYNTSGYYTVTGQKDEKQAISYIAKGLPSDKEMYYTVSLKYTNNESNEVIEESINQYFTTLNKISIPKDVNILGFTFHVQKPYFFSMMILVGLTVSVLLLGTGVNLSGTGYGAEKVLIYLLVGFSILLLIWLSIVDLIPSSQLIITLIGVLGLSGYYLFSGVRGGGVYG